MAAGNASAGRRAVAQAGVRVDRAVSELRRGRLVRLSSGAEELLVGAVEALQPAAWDELADTAAGRDGQRPSVTLTAERAQASGWLRATAAVLADDAVATLDPVGMAGSEPASVAPITLRLPESFDPALLGDLAGIGMHGREGAAPASGAPEVDRWTGLLGAQPAAPVSQTTAAMRAALELTRLARLVPAVVTLDAGFAAPQTDDGHELHLRVSDEDIRAYPQERARSLLRVSEAPVPLAGHEKSRFVLFRETVADLEHVAIVIGEPDPAQPVLVRLHSSCLTGDLFASLRCDCGDQLRGAIDRLGEDGGVLLYLAQEGRGIGLANKLRAYDRQDAGLDTIDADRYLGFRGDERNFAVAVQMLRELGIGRIRLLTNNPAKIAALRQAGIDVVERIGIGGPVNRHNERYIATKRDRAGHLIEVANLPVQRQAS
jgi:GTP cyclohydrolase II